MAFSNSQIAALHTAGIFSDSSVDGPEIGTLVAVVDRAKNLPNRKKMGKQDPYCAARLGKEAKKTNTDRRGGQTPRWDEELRFTVLESPDYYTLKISIFNDDKKTELIGETWADLNDVVVPGGGQSDIWHGLKCKGKYAGEVRIELTYYDTRPQVDNPAAVRASSRMEEEGGTPSASLKERTPVRRRPLPSNPGSGAASPVEFARSQATGSRGLGNSPHPRSAEQTPSHQRRSVYNNDQPHIVESRRPLPQLSQGYPEVDEHDPFAQSHYIENNNDPYALEYTSHTNSGMDVYGNGDQNEIGRYAPSASGQHYSSDPADFLPQLPPMSRSRDDPAPRRSHMSLNGDYRAQDIPPPPLDHSYSAPVVIEQQYAHEPPHQRLSITHARSEPHLHEAHLQSFREPIHPHDNGYAVPSEYPALDSGYGSNEGRELVYHPDAFHGHHEEHYDLRPDVGSSYSGVPDEGEIPPPPPLHRDKTSETRRRYSAFPTYGDANSSFPPAHNGHLIHPGQNPTEGMRYEFPGLPSSKSELSLRRYTGPPEPLQPQDNRMVHHHRASMDHYGQEADSFANPPRNFGDHQPVAERGHGQRTSFGSYGNSNQGENPYSPITSSPLAIESPQPPWNERRNSFQPNHSRHGSASRTASYDPQQSQTHPAPLWATPVTSPRHSPHGSAVVSAQHTPAYDTPTRPHPLSQQHTLPTSSPYSPSADPQYPYDQSQIIKPLSISPTKSRMSNPATPTSHDRVFKPQVRTPTTRKSVSPRPPPSSAANTDFGVPFGPDSYEAFNPAVSVGSGTPGSHPREQTSSLYPKDAAPIVDFHGNVVDPSDRLPETIWAPEPTPKSPGAGLDPSDHLPSSSWAPEPEPKGPPRIVPLRYREKLNGTRDPSQRSSLGSNGRNPTSRTSMIAVSHGGAHSSPPTDLNGSPTSFRARLTKKPPNRPQSMAVVPSWDQPIQNIPMLPLTGDSPAGYGGQAGPLVPAKLKKDSPGRGSGYGIPGYGSPQYGSPAYAQGGSPGYQAGGSPGYAGGSGMDRLSAEIQSIDIGAESTRRVGGRRLLGFKG